MSSRPLDHSRHIAVTLGTLTHQQQVATLDSPAETGDRHFVAALPAPHIGQQPLADVGGDGFPTLAGGTSEVGE